MENYTLEKKDYVDLWRYFSEDTAKIKDKFWTIASWLYALMSGLLGFTVKYGYSLGFVAILIYSLLK